MKNAGDEEEIRRLRSEQTLLEEKRTVAFIVGRALSQAKSAYSSAVLLALAAFHPLGARMCENPLQVVLSVSTVLIYRLNRHQKQNRTECLVRMTLMMRRGAPCWRFVLPMEVQSHRHTMGRTCGPRIPCVSQSTILDPSPSTNTAGESA